MGCLRTLLAVSVVFVHAYGFVFVGGIFAVQLFYIISGFLISFVLIEARSYGSVLAFYENRALRLFPIYFVVAVGTLALYFSVSLMFGVDAPFIEVFQSIDWRGKLALAITNVTVFGQDWIMFTAVNDGVFQFSSNYLETEIKVWHGLIVPQAWTLGVELSFYLVAPFVLPRMRLMLVLLALSLGLRLAFIAAGFGLSDPWSYRFFPTELALFLLGALSHQLWLPYLRQRGWLTEKAAIYVTGAIFIYCVVYFLLPGRSFHRLALMAVFILSLPFLFHFQRLFRFDRKIGDLSYPIYISHLAVLLPVSFVFDRLKDDPGYRGLDETFVVLALTLAASLILNRFVGEKIEIRRDRVRNRKLTTQKGNEHVNKQPITG